MSDIVSLASGLTSGSSSAVTLNQNGPWQLSLWGTFSGSGSNHIGMNLEQSPDGGTTWLPVNFMQHSVDTGSSPHTYSVLLAPVDISAVLTGIQGNIAVPVYPIDLPSPVLVRLTLTGSVDGSTSVSAAMQPLSSCSMI